MNFHKLIYKSLHSKKKCKKLKDLRKHVGLVFQFPEYQLFEETIEDDVAFGPMNFGVKKDEALKLAHECLKTVGIPESYYKKSPFEISGGEKRRVAIAGILAIKPKVLVFDIIIFHQVMSNFAKGSNFAKEGKYVTNFILGNIIRESFLFQGVF